MKISKVFFFLEYIISKDFLKKTHFKSFLVTHFFVKISSGQCFTTQAQTFGITNINMVFQSDHCRYLFHGTYIQRQISICFIFILFYFIDV